MINRILTVGGFTLLSRATGFARDIILAAVLGAGPVADAFFVALRLPNHFRAIFAEGAFNAAFVPAYARIRESGGAGRAAIFADRIFTLLLASQIVLLAVALLFTPAVIEVLAPGFSHDPGRFALAVELTRITFPYLLLVTLVTLYGGILNALQRFAAAAAAPILLNLSLIVALAFAAFFPTAGHAAAWGVLVAGVLEFLLVAGDAGMAGVLTKFRWPELDADVRQFFRALGTGDRRLGRRPARFVRGHDHRELFAGGRVVGALLRRPAQPAADRRHRHRGRHSHSARTSCRIAGGDHHGAAHAQGRAIEFTLLLSIPCIAAFFVIPDLIMRALFMRGAFTAADADAAAHAHGLRIRFVAVRAHPQRGCNFLCARGYGDTGQGGVACRRGQHRLQGAADGTARAGRPRVGDVDRAWINLGLVVWFAVRAGHISLRTLAPVSSAVRHRRRRACCSVVAVSRARCRLGRELARPA